MPRSPLAESVELTADACAALLGSHHFGRIGLQGRDGPAIYPVNYVWDGGHVAVRTNPGTKVADSAQTQVAFEIDGVDDSSRTGWSVLVVGTAYEVTDSMDAVSAALRALPVDTWAPGQNAVWLRIQPRSVTGRAVRAGGDGV